MRTAALLVATSLGIAAAACTKDNPEYCENDEACPNGSSCDLDLNRCVETPDAAPAPDAGRADASPTNDAGGPVAFARQFGDTGYDSADGVGVDAAGNVFVAGIFQGTVDFGDGEVTSAGGNRSIFIAKYRRDGTHVWSRTFQATVAQTVSDLSISVEGDIVLCGSFRGTLDFGGGVIANPDVTNDGFVAVFSSSGSHVWSKAFGGATTPNAVATDGVAVFVAGGFTGTVDFGNGDVFGDSSIFFARYRAADGAHEWSRTYSSSDPSGNYAYDIALDSAGDLVVTGQFWGDINLGGGTISSKGFYDVFLAKYRGTDAAHLWSKPFGNANINLGWAVATDSENNVLLVGEFADEIDFGGTPLSTATYSYFAAKFSSLGGHLWSRELPGRDDVAVVANDDVVVAAQSELLLLSAATGATIGGWDLTGALEPRVDTSSNAVVAAGRFMDDLVFDGGSFTTAGGFDAFLFQSTP